MARNEKREGSSVSLKSTTSLLQIHARAHTWRGGSEGFSLFAGGDNESRHLHLLQTSWLSIEITSTAVFTDECATFRFVNVHQLIFFLLQSSLSNFHISLGSQTPHPSRTTFPAICSACLAAQFHLQPHLFCFLRLPDSPLCFSSFSARPPRRWLRWHPCSTVPVANIKESGAE